MNAEGARFVPPVNMAQMQLVDRDVPLFAYEAVEGAGSLVGGAAAPWGRKARAGCRCVMPAPMWPRCFQTLCAAQGIKLPQAEVVYALPAAAVEIVRHECEALPDVLRKMLKFSTNLTAEVVGLAASGAGTSSGSAAVMTSWARRRFGIAARCLAIIPALAR